MFARVPFDKLRDRPKGDRRATEGPGHDPETETEA